MDRKVNEQVSEHGKVCQRKEATATLHEKHHRDHGKDDRKYLSANDSYIKDRTLNVY